VLLHSFPLNSQIVIAANKDLDLRSVQDLRYSRHCLILGIFFLTGFFIFILLQICQYYVYFGEFLVMSTLGWRSKGPCIFASC